MNQSSLAKRIDSEIRPDQDRATKVMAEAESLWEEVGKKSIALAILLAEIRENQYYTLKGFKTWKGYVQETFKFSHAWACMLVATVKKAKRMKVYEEMIESGQKITRLKEILRSDDKERVRWLLKNNGKVKTGSIRTEQGRTMQVALQIKPNTWASLKELKKEMEAESIDQVISELISLYVDWQKQRNIYK